MKLPNGFGSVDRLSDARRKPWRARKTISSVIDPVSGKRVLKRLTVGYFRTKKEAMLALSLYDVRMNASTVTDLPTFADVYEQWSAVHFEKITPSATRVWKSVYNHCSQLHNLPFANIKTADLENAIKSADLGAGSKSRMKSLFNLMYKYALAHEICDKDYAALCSEVARPAPELVREPYNAEQIKVLYERRAVSVCDMILIGIYSGWRPQELCKLKLVDIDLSACTMRGGSKTDAGKDRLVPIHPAIQSLIRDRIERSTALESEYLFNDPDNNAGLTYDMYRRRTEKVNALIGAHHLAHDTRHTFITLAKQYEVDEYILKRIVGHSLQDVTEKVYTHRTIEQFKKEIEKIPALF